MDGIPEEDSRPCPRHRRTAQGFGGPVTLRCGEAPGGRSPEAAYTPGVMVREARHLGAGADPCAHAVGGGTHPRPDATAGGARR